jgi:hypothetical protein
MSRAFVFQSALGELGTVDAQVARWREAASDSELELRRLRFDFNSSVHVQFD